MTNRNVLALPLTFCALALMSTPAIANTAHHFSYSFGVAGEGAGDLALVASQPEFPEVGGSGVAVDDETHDVYVADTNNNRVDEFEADGTFIRAWGWGVADGISEELQTCSTTCFKGLPGSGPGELESPTFIAVDNDPASPSHGDVYVAGAGQRAESPTNLVQKFTSDGVLLSAWGADGQLDGSSAPNGPFGQPAGLAVDSTGDLWVFVRGDVRTGNNQVYEFDQGGDFERDWEPLETGEFAPQGIAVDASGHVYITKNAFELQQYSGTGVFLGTVSEHDLDGYLARVISGFAVAPASRDVYVDVGSAVEHFDSSCDPGPSKPCSPAETFGSPVVSDGAGVAVDTSSSSVFVAETAANRIEVFGASLEADTGAAAGVLANTATVDGTVNPEGSTVTRCVVEYGETEEYGQSVPCEAPAAGEIGAGQATVPVRAAFQGLQGGTSYHYRLVAANEAGGVLYGEDRQLTTAPTPLIADTAAVDVGAESATLIATVNPLGVAVTSCVFEYGPSAAYGNAVPCAQSAAQIGSGNAAVPVSASIAGLAANTEYHWRLVAENTNGSSANTRGSADHTFVYDTSGSALPDGRAYEMVTPPAKNGASIGKVVIGPIYDLADDGDRVIAPSIQCFAEAQGCTGDRQQEGEPYEFTRTPHGWVTTPLAPPATKYDASSAWEVGADQGVALFSMPTEPGGEDDFYAREQDGAFIDVGPTTPPGTTGVAQLGYIHGTADLSHVAYETKAAAWPLDRSQANGLYEYVGSGNAEPLVVAVSGVRGSTELISTCGAQMGGKETAEALSADGSIVDFLAHECRAGGTGANAGIAVPVDELFARVAGEGADAHTVAISEPKAPETLAAAPADETCTTPECEKNVTETANWRAAKFAAASADGSNVLFTSSQQLTDQATQDRGENLYLYDFSNPAGHNLIDVSAGDVSGLGPQVQGVVAASPDGTHVYFIAQGVLTATANAQGQSARAGRDNLYVYERDARYPEGHTAYIATVPSTDLEGLGKKEANVTPDGSFLVFTSDAVLTADDTRSDGAAQVFRYDAETERLARVSVGDLGYDDNGNAGTGDATIVTAVYGEAKAGFPRTDPTMSNDGEYVFFQSPIGLTPGALDDIVIGHDEGRTQYAQNVYEYHDGRVYLISDGRDLAATPTHCNFGSAVCLLGADATGANVFFTTASRLVPADTDTQTDIYDARICTTAEPCIPPSPLSPPACLGEACHGIPAPAPTPLAPGTATFDGAGNLVPSIPVAVRSQPLTKAQKLARALKTCRRIKRQARRASCERQARRHYITKPSAKQAHRTTSHRRRKP
jgi:hypothetical protein